MQNFGSATLIYITEYNVVGAIHELPVLKLCVDSRLVKDAEPYKRHNKIDLKRWLPLSGELSFAKQKD